MTKQIRIDDDIPVPHPSNRGRPLGVVAKAMKKLQPGQSFYRKANLNTLQTLAARYLGVGKYEIRAEGNGWRVWRRV